MIRHDPPAPPPTGDVPERLAKSHQMKVWLRRLLDVPPDQVVDISDVDPVLLGVLTEELVKRRDISAPTSKLRKWVRELTPLLSCPQFDDLPGDTRLMLSLPQMQQMWGEWQLRDAPVSDRRSGSFGARGPNALTRGTKAVLLTMASPGSNSYLKHAHGLVAGSAALQNVYRDLLHELHDAGGDPQFSVPAYPTVARHWQVLLAQARKPALRANIAMLQALRDLDQRRLDSLRGPAKRSRIGRGLMVDATWIPAWAQQWAPARSLSPAERERIEARLTELAPDAKFRAYSQRSSGEKVSIHRDGNLAGSVRAGKSKVWRGFLLCAIVDQATGLPLVWTMIAADQYEGVALLTMLAELHELWPDIDAEWIAGDGLYDDDDLCRLCVQNYGIHPIFRHNGRNSARLTGVERRPYDALDKHGRVICSTHKKPMDYVSYTAASRDGLRPGQASDAAAIDMRVACTTDESATKGAAYGPCGTRIRVDPSGDWSRLVKYPHYPDGHPDRYAFRKAVEMRLNGIESAWAALKTAHQLGGPGANRARLRDLRAFEGAVSLAFVQRAALTLWDQLDRAGQTPRALRHRPVHGTVASGGQPITISRDNDGNLVGVIKAAPASPPRRTSSHPLAGRRGRGRKTARPRERT